LPSCPAKLRARLDGVPDSHLKLQFIEIIEKRKLVVLFLLAKIKRRQIGNQSGRDR